MIYSLRRAIKRIVFGGKKYYCPCCATGLRKLNDISPNRLNAECPVCLSRERGRLLWLFFERETGIFKGNIKLLHVAPEMQFSLRFSEFKNIEYIGVDMFTEGYTSYHKSTQYADITDLKNFTDNTFDYIICSHVLEHVPADLKAMTELRRVVKPGGHAYILIPQDLTKQETNEDPSIVTPEQRAKYFGQYDHVRMYGLDFTDRLMKAGFKVSVIDYVKKLSSTEIEKFRLRSELIYDCTK
jgi:SAM-dependent methyltransferase